MQRLAVLLVTGMSVACAATVLAQAPAQPSAPPASPAAGAAPAAPRYESRLEIVDIRSGERRVVHRAPVRFEAPNWSRDGKHLLINQQGALYRVPVEGGTPVKVDLGTIEGCNNDHGYSPDGKWLAISCRPSSSVYVVPAAGGTPRLLTPRTPSYWHGWSPDGTTLAYVRVGVSDGSYDIWAQDLAGGAPRPLVTGPGVDDGPEYSPDGRHLYFNSTRSGAMALWRAGADGSEPVQLTRDPARRDWFPHLSPDGRSIVYVSFGDDVALEDHPPNREDVQLRIMPADDIEPPAILTRLFGGQGTINVP